MGTTRPIQGLDVSHLKNPNAWEVIENAGECNVLRNIQSGEQVQEYILSLDGSEDLLKEYEKYQYRLHQQQNLVRVFYVQREASQYICSGSRLLRVMTERISYRLAQVKNLSHPQTIFALHESLIGFRVICERIGPIWLNSNLVCFTPNGKVKVWLNENLAKNEPQADMRTIQGGIEIYPTEEMMVNELFHMFEQHCVKQQYPSMFKARLETQSIKTFFQAIAFIHDYTELEEVQLPRSIKPPKSLIQHVIPEHNETGNSHRTKLKSTNTIENIPQIHFQRIPRIETEPNSQTTVRIFHNNRNEKNLPADIIDRHTRLNHPTRTEYLGEVTTKPLGLPPRMIRHKATKSIADLNSFKIQDKRKELPVRVKDLSQHRKQSEQKTNGFSFRKQIIIRQPSKNIATCPSKETLQPRHPSSSGNKPSNEYQKVSNSGTVIIRAESNNDKKQQIMGNRTSLPTTNIFQKEISSTRQSQASEGIKILNRLSSKH